MKTIRRFLLLLFMAVAISSCERSEPDGSAIPAGDMKDLYVTHAGTRAKSSLMIKFPSGDRHPFVESAHGKTSESEVESGFGSRFITLITDQIKLTNRRDFLAFTITYDEPVPFIKGGRLDLKYIDLIWPASNNPDDRVVNKYSGIITAEDMTETDFLLHFTNVIIHLSDGDYSIDGFLSISR